MRQSPGAECFRPSCSWADGANAFAFFFARFGLRDREAVNLCSSERRNCRAGAALPQGHPALAAAQLSGIRAATVRVGQVLSDGRAVLPLRAVRPGRPRAYRGRGAEGTTEGAESTRARSRGWEAASRDRARASVDRVRLDPATPAHA